MGVFASFSPFQEASGLLSASFHGVSTLASPVCGASPTRFAPWSSSPFEFEEGLFPHYIGAPFGRTTAGFDRDSSSSWATRLIDGLFPLVSHGAFGEILVASALFGLGSPSALLHVPIKSYLKGPSLFLRGIASASPFPWLSLSLSSSAPSKSPSLLLRS